MKTHTIEERGEAKGRIKNAWGIFRVNDIAERKDTRIYEGLHSRMQEKYEQAKRQKKIEIENEP